MTNARQYIAWVGALVLVELVSLGAFVTSQQPISAFSPMTIATFAIALGAAVLAWRRPTWLAWVTLTELVIGGKGYLFFLQDGETKISIRLVLFVLLMTAWFLRRMFTIRSAWPRWSWPMIGILGWVAVMSVVGLVRGYGTSAVYTDMNGYLYLALLLPWWHFLRVDRSWRATAMVVLLAGATIIGVKSWLMQSLFAHDVPWMLELYRWIRQTGIGEITLISKNVYRVFFQSQIFALLGLVVILTGFVLRRFSSWWSYAFLSSSLAVYLSLSRSYWLGLAVAFGSLSLGLVLQRQWRQLRRFWILLPTGMFVWMMATLAMNFPYIIPPPNHASSADAVVARLRSAGSRQASTARANQFPPLATAILNNPITGHGFGAQLTYTSTDPRIRGARTTSAFELGYLDMAYHFGVIGLGLFGWWIWAILRRLWQRQERWVWIPSTLALLAVHLTSPYLNHPLGLGWLCLMTVVAYDDE